MSQTEHLVGTNLELKKCFECHDRPLLGEVKRAFSADLAPLYHEVKKLRSERSSRTQKKETELKKVWHSYDKALDGRADYCLWRKLLYDKPQTSFSEEWPPLINLVEDALNSRDETVLWGAFLVVSKLLRNNHREIFDPFEAAKIGLLLKKRVGQTQPIERARVGCQVAKLIALDGANGAIYKNYGVGTYKEAALQDLEMNIGALQKLDPNWEPGDKISFQCLKNEAHRGHVLLPYRLHDIRLIVQRVLFRLRHAVRVGVKHSDYESLRLLAATSLSSWKMVRGIRRRQQMRADKGKRSMNTDALFHDELNALREAAVAFLEADAPQISAALSCYLLRIIPDSLAKNDEYRDMGKGSAFWIRCAGYEVDPRFVEVRAKNVNGENGESSNIEEDRNIQTDSPDSTSVLPDSERKDFYRERIEHDRKRMEEWQEIINLYPEKEWPLRWWVSDLKKERVSLNQSKLHAAWTLAMRYGRLADAAEVLNRISSPEPKEILRFASAIQKAQNLLPYGIDVKRNGFWRRCLKRAWRRSLKGRSTSDFEEPFFIHETLLGRHIALASALSEKEKRLLIRKYYDTLEDKEIDHALEPALKNSEDSSDPATQRDISRCIERLREPGLGKPIFVSTVRIGDEQLSVLIVGANGYWNHNVLNLPHIEQCMRQVKEGLCFLSHADTVMWNASLRELRRHVVSKVREMEQEVEWIVFVPDPELAALPLQHLFTEAHGAEFLISQMPNIGWAIKDVGSQSYSIEHDLLLGHEEELSELTGAIRRQSDKLMRRMRTALITVGHGEPSPQSSLYSIPRIPSVKIRDEEMQIGKWIEKTNRMFCLLHTCFGGHAGPTVLGDIGGLPGVALSMGCKLFVAPVAEVSTKTALSLHQEIIREENSRKPFGHVYLKAIEKNNSVSLYNLYGFANTSLTG